MKMVDRDWGGADRLDHVAAVQHLRSDPLLDMDRAGVMGRSYGGYMTLTLACPLLVIQGANDPRVVQAESDDLVMWLGEMGKRVEYLVFPDEGHDMVKTSNKIRCYRAIVDFFSEHLRP